MGSERRGGPRHWGRLGLGLSAKNPYDAKPYGQENNISLLGSVKFHAERHSVLLCRTGFFDRSGKATGKKNTEAPPGYRRSRIIILSVLLRSAVTTVFSFAVVRQIGNLYRYLGSTEEAKIHNKNTGQEKGVKR